VTTLISILLDVLASMALLIVGVSAVGLILVLYYSARDWQGRGVERMIEEMDDERV
jgi:hypothetical protein